MSDLKLPEQHTQFGTSLFKGYSTFQAPEYRIVMTFIFAGGVDANRHEDVLWPGVFKFGRHNPNDCILAPVDVNWCPDRRRIGGETAPPEPITQDRHALPAWTVFNLRKSPSPCRRNSQNPKEVGRNRYPADVFGLALIRHVSIGPHRLSCSNPVERLHLVAEEGKLQLAQVGGFPFLLESAAHLHNPIRIGIWQRAQQDSVYYSEDRRVGTYAKRQGENGDQREPRRLYQRPHPIAKVLPHVCHILPHNITLNRGHWDSIIPAKMATSIRD